MSARTPKKGAATPPRREPPTAPRQPRQERGQRRVDAILDATAAIVAEGGLPAATMHAIARRSGTTIGSLYHFFPDRDAVVVALAERHGVAIGEMAAVLAGVDWQALSLEDAVDRYVETGIEYVRRHPDLFPVAQAALAIRPDLRQRETSPEHLLLAVTKAIVAARTPDAPAAERTVRAVMMLALVEGVVERSTRITNPSPATMLRELKRALCAYLGSYEG
jgi:AcrR family transcriptional regulator